MTWVKTEKQKIDLSVDGGGGWRVLTDSFFHSLPVFACQSVIILTSSNRLDIAFEKSILLARLNVAVICLVHMWNLRSRAFHKQLVCVCRKCAVGGVKKLVGILYKEVQLEYRRKE